MEIWLNRLYNVFCISLKIERKSQPFVLFSSFLDKVDVATLQHLNLDLCINRRGPKSIPTIVKVLTKVGVAMLQIPKR